MTEKDRPAVGTQIRVLDPGHISVPVGTVLDVIPDGEYNGWFGLEEITVLEPGKSDPEDTWYADLALEGTAWERVEEEA